MEPAEAFGRVIRQRRTDASMSQEKLALEAGVARVFVSWLETGQKQPTFRTMLKLAAVLGCTATDLVRDAEKLMGSDSADA